jgi:glucose/arabinose dehydrogenase
MRTRRPQFLALALCLSASLAHAASAGAAVKLQKIGDFDDPVYVSAPPDTRRLLVVEQGGTIRLFKDGVLKDKPFLNVPHVKHAGEQGLLSMAFHPNYASNRRFYVFYVHDDLCSGSNCDIVVDEYKRSKDNSNRADARSRRRVIRVAHRDHANHNGGQLQFGPDGFLYIGDGDGGGSGDPEGNAQDVNSLLGKILRINPLKSGDKPYTVPSSNPLVGEPGADEVWALGLRNPWRFSFDHATGDLVIGDVGQNKREEVDFQAAGFAGGANYQWPVCEGDLQYDTFNPCAAPPAGSIPPVFTYATHVNGTCSITGGYVSRDESVPETLGDYLYGDFCQGDVHKVTVGPGGASGDTGLGVNVDNLSSFGEDARCRLYATSLNGPVYRIESDDPDPLGCDEG